VKNWRHRREELEGSERGQVSGCVWGWLRRQCGCIACLFWSAGYAARICGMTSILEKLA